MTHKSVQHLTDRFFAIYGLWQIVGVMGLVETAALVVYALGTIVLSVLVWTDRRSLLKTQRLQAALTLPHSVELEQSICPEATLQIVQENPLLPASIEWSAPSLSALRFAHPLVLFQSEGESGLSASHPATATGLGYFEWTSVGLVVRSRLRLWHQILELPVDPSGIRVHPSFRKIPEQAFVEQVANQRLLTQGTRKMMRGQAADQFRSIRRYQFPDSLRHIDGKKSAKYGRLMTRVYDECRAHHLILALDLGRSMVGRLKQSAKHDYYLSACLTLAQQAITSGDHVSFFAFANTLTYAIRNSRHLASFEPLFKGDPRLCARETESRFELLSPTIASMTGQRSIVLVLTDLTSPSVQQGLLDALAPVCQHHLTLAVGLQDQKLGLNDFIWELNPDHLSEREQAHLLYASWLNDRFQLFRLQMAQLGGGVVQGVDDTWLSLVTQIYARLRESLRA